MARLEIIISRPRAIFSTKPLEQTGESPSSPLPQPPFFRILVPRGRGAGSRFGAGRAEVSARGGRLA